MDNKDFASELFIKNIIAKNTQMYFIFSALVALFIYTVLRDENISSLTFWLACIETNIIGLALLHTLSTKKRVDPLKNILFKIGIITNGLLWGAFSIVSLSVMNIESQALIIIALIAIVSLGVPLLASSPRLALLFSSVILLPLSAYFLFKFTFISIGKSLVVALLVLAITRVASIIHDFQKHSESLRKKHQSLIEQLNVEAQKSESANIELKNEIAEKKKTEGSLIKARDQAENALKAKSEFLATMSHEIRTPMNGVLGMTELLSGTDLSNKQKRFTETIHKSGSALLTIINDILDFSKIEAGKLELNNSVFDLRLLLEDIGTMFAEQAHRKNLNLSCIYPADGHAMFRGDPERIRQILTNLIGNAIKFTEKGEILCKVELIEQNSNDFLVRFRVQDTGIGIHTDAQGKIFDSFSQADNTTTRKFGGTGLGLAISKMLVKLMKGKIGVKSQAGRGSIFWFAIPLMKEAAVTQSLSQTLPQNFSHFRVMIADANPTSRQVLEQQLDNWDLDYYSIDNGKKALLKMKEAAQQGQPFSLAILDNELPGMNGIALAKKIKDDPEIMDVKLIMVSSVGNLEQTGQWLMAGIESYLSKPIRQNELYESISKALTPASSSKMKVKKNKSFNPEKTISLTGHILVAEDNIVNQELVREMLTKLGCTVEVVENGRIALEIISDCPLDNLHKPFDVILMDCQMPEMDGFEATTNIRNWENQQKVLNRIPIIALTANAMEGDREKCINSGMDDYMTKPFNLKQIGALLHRWLPLLAKENVSEFARLNKHNKKAEQVLEVSPPTRSKKVQSLPTKLSPLDTNAFTKIRRLQREGQENIVIKVIKLFLENSQKTLLSVESAISKGETEALQRAATSLKSSCLTIGATELAKLCLELIELGKLGNSGQAQSRLGILEFEYDEACKALHSIIVEEQEAEVASN